LQALTLMNDPLFMASARELARKAAAADNDRDRMRYVFRRTVAREPSDEDVADLAKLLSESRKYYTENREAAEKVAGKGYLDAAEGAAWTLLARTVLNLDEVITRE
jgi:hypothetical protein